MKTSGSGITPKNDKEATLSHKRAYCGEQNANTIDHIIPQLQNGSHDPVNLVWACRPCNSRKGGRTPEQAGMILTMYPESIVKEPYRSHQKQRIAWGSDEITLTRDGFLEILERLARPNLPNLNSKIIDEKLTLESND